MFSYYTLNNATAWRWVEMLPLCKGEKYKLKVVDGEGDEIRSDDSENEIGSLYSIELEGITLSKLQKVKLCSFYGPVKRSLL